MHCRNKKTCNQKEELAVGPGLPERRIQDAALWPPDSINHITTVAPSMASTASLDNIDANKTWIGGEVSKLQLAVGILLN